MSDEWEECYDDVIRIKIASPQVCAWVASRPPEVYFTNVLQAAFIQKIPKSQKDTTDDLTVFFALLGSALIKAAQKHVGEIDPCSQVH